jgi:hypothetical protein
MVTPQGIVMVLVGSMACFMGYSMFRSMLPLWGFILGGLIVMTTVPNFIQVAPSQNLFLLISSFLVGGLIGALIANPLYYVIIFLSGAALGALIGIIAGAFLDMGGITSFRDIQAISNMNFPFPPQVTSVTQLVLIIILGGILGMAALNFSQFMITASTAFLGAAVMVSGFSAVITNSFPNMSANALMMVAWLLIGMVGVFVQFRVLGDEV